MAPVCPSPSCFFFLLTLLSALSSCAVTPSRNLANASSYSFTSSTCESSILVLFLFRHEDYDYSVFHHRRSVSLPLDELHTPFSPLSCFLVLRTRENQLVKSLFQSFTAWTSASVALRPSLFIFPSSMKTFNEVLLYRNAASCSRTSSLLALVTVLSHLPSSSFRMVHKSGRYTLHSSSYPVKSIFTSGLPGELPWWLLH